MHQPMCVFCCCCRCCCCCCCCCCFFLTEKSLRKQIIEIAKSVLIILSYSNSFRWMQNHWIHSWGQGQGSRKSRDQKYACFKQRRVRSKLLRGTQLCIFQLWPYREWSAGMWVKRSHSPTGRQQRLCLAARLYLPIYQGMCNVVIYY